MFTRIFLPIRLYIIIIFSPFEWYACMCQFLQNIVTPDMGYASFQILVVPLALGETTPPLELWCFPLNIINILS
jgi:hypothetical protein